jgi:hypothetical protein
MHGPLNVKQASNYLPSACGSAVLTPKDERAVLGTRQRIVKFHE